MTDFNIAAEQIRQWREYPVQFVYDQFGVDPDPWQRDVLEAFPYNQRLAMKACKGPGKTAILAWCAWNFLSTRPHPKCAATSITADNLADNLWPELAKWRNKSEYLKHAFEWTKTRVFAKQHPETWFLSARTWSKGADQEQQANTLAGLHADYLLFILDESGGIPNAVMAAAEGGLSTGIECKIMQAGNPTHLEGPLYAAVTNEAHLWKVFEITGDPDDPKRSPRISMQWAREQIEKYGRDNPWVLVNVFGKFPPSSLNALFSPDEVQAAMERHLRKDQYDFAAKVLGIDTARFGDDKNVIFPRQGKAAFMPVITRNQRSHEFAARIAKAHNKWDADAMFLDSTGGWSTGVEDSLIQSGHTPIPIAFNGKASDPRYVNIRAEMYFEASEWVKNGGALPNVPNLKRQLCAIKYDFQNGKFKVIDKDQIKEDLGGESPDESDGFALTFAQPVVPKPRNKLEDQLQSDNHRAKTEYDPFDDSRYQ